MPDLMDLVTPSSDLNVHNPGLIDALGEEYLDPALSSLVIAPYVGRPNPDKQERLSLLSPRELEVCQLLADIERFVL